MMNCKLRSSRSWYKGLRPLTGDLTAPPPILPHQPAYKARVHQMASLGWLQKAYRITAAYTRWDGGAPEIRQEMRTWRLKPQLSAIGSFLEVQSDRPPTDREYRLFANRGIPPANFGKGLIKLRIIGLNCK